MLQGIPSLQETMREITSKLTAILALVQRHACHGCSGIDCDDQMVAGDVLDEPPRGEWSVSSVGEEGVAFL